MNPLKLTGGALVLAGAMALVYGGFSYTRQTDVLKVGPIELSVQERKSFPVPVWAGLAAIAIGAALFFAGRKA